MPTRAAHFCSQREATESLARGQLVGELRVHVERHLERCEPCRTLFRHLTGERYPKFRDYTILGETGRGGFGVVYKAIHHGKERVEALKVLFGGTPTRAAYFENEVHLVARLRHPNIATLYEAHLRASPLHYTMEFVEGEQLDDYCRRREVSLERRIEVIKTVAAAIEYAHQQGVIHRDLKPQNIIIDAEGQPRIVDFGIAKRLGLSAEDGGAERSRSGDEGQQQSPSGSEGQERSPSGSEGHGRGPIVGTLGYTAPEQLAGRTVDRRADVYSLGVLLFHVITGEPARFAPDAGRLAAVLHERQVSRADDLAAIIACCVHPAPEQRYASCAALAADLDRYLAGRPIQARRNPTLAYRATRIAAYVLHHHPRPVHVLVAVAVALVLTAIFWKAGAHWLAHPGGAGQTVLIAFTPSTLDGLREGRIGADLPGLDVNQRKSWRLLYGRLMERLAEAEPGVVVWDYHFPDRWPEYDAGFVRAVQGLRAPVIVGSAAFDVDGEPVLCPEIRAAVHGWGALQSKQPEHLRTEVAAPLAIQRGLNPPAPALALAGFAAARFPECMAEVSVAGDHLQLRYRKQQVAPGASRWRTETDQIPFFEAERIEPQHDQLAPGDRSFLGRFQLAGVEDWAARAVPAEAVLTADRGQLRRWFSGRAVLIGEMLPGSDLHQLASGRNVYGCQVQATLLDALLSGGFIQRVTRAGVAVRVACWGALALLLASFVPARHRWSLRSGALVAILLLVLGSVLATRLTTGVNPWDLEVTIALAALLAIGGPIFLVRLLHQRQLHLVPGPAWSASGTTGPTTVLAQPASDSPRQDSQEAVPPL